MIKSAVRLSASVGGMTVRNGTAPDRLPLGSPVIFAQAVRKRAASVSFVAAFAERSAASSQLSSSGVNPLRLI